MRRHPLTAAALLSAAVLIVPAAPALAAGHGHGHATGHQATTHGHAQNTHASQAHGQHAQQLRGATHAVANQLRQVNRLADLVANSAKISDTDRTAVSGALQADVDAITALQSQLADATSHHDVVSAVHQGILIRAVARTQTTVAEQAGEVRAAAAAATAPTTTTTDPTTTTTTTDPTTTTTTDPTTTTTTDPTTTATSDADAAVAAVVALQPDSTRTQIHQARQTAEAALADADTALGISTGTDGSDGSGDTTSGSSTPTA